MAYMFKFCFHGIHHGRILYGNELLGNVLRSSYYVGFCVLLVLTEMGNARASEAWSEYEAVSHASFFYITNLLGGGRRTFVCIKICSVADVRRKIHIILKKHSLMECLE